MNTTLHLLLINFIINILFCCIIHDLAVEARRISRGVKCRPGEYYSFPAESCISCHVPCDNARMKKTQDICSNYCPDFTKPLEQNQERRTAPQESNLSWIAGPVVGGIVMLIVILLMIYYRKHHCGNKRQRNVAHHVDEQELQILDPQPRLDTLPGNSTVSDISEERPLISVLYVSENHHDPLELNNTPCNSASGSNEYVASASQLFHISTSADQHNDSIRGPISYTSEQGYRVVEEESDTVVMKPVVESQTALVVLRCESVSLQNGNNLVTQPHRSYGRDIVVQESLVRAEVSCSTSRSQLYYHENIPSIHEHNDCPPDFIDASSYACHDDVMEHSVRAHHELFAPPDIASFATNLSTSVSIMTIPVIVEHPEGDPDNFEWQEQQRRAAQDKICLHQSVIGKNKHNEKEFCMDRPKTLTSSISD